MIRATTEANGQRTVLLGLSGENVTRLAAGEPIRVDLGKLGVPDVTVILTYGRTEDAILAELEALGVRIRSVTDERSRGTS